MDTLHPLQKMYKIHDINQNRLAAKANLDYRTLSNIVNRNAKLTNIRFGTIEALAKAFDISIEAFSKEWRSYEDNY